MPKCCPLFLAVGSKSGCVEEATSSLSFSMLACGFLGTCLPAELELEGKSRTDGGARVGEENSCSISLFSRLPQTELGLPPRRGVQVAAVFLKQRGFPHWRGCRFHRPGSPHGEAGRGREWPRLLWAARFLQPAVWDCWYLVSAVAGRQ